MKERPILFSAPMVRAILEGRKTQTRWVIKEADNGVTTCIEDGQAWYDDLDGPGFRPRPCPFGQVGDRIWVREGHITLEITGVRVERLHSISEADAIAEGVDQTNTSIGGYATERFKRLWQSINGPESWAANPWVWAIEFRKLESGE